MPIFPMTGTKTRDLGYQTKSEAVRAIHGAEKTDFLQGPAKAMAPLFTKTNTADGAVVRAKVPGLTQTSITADSAGRVTERSTNVNPVVHAGHYLLTDVFEGTKKAGGR